MKIVILRFHKNFYLILTELKGDFCCEDEKLTILKAVLLEQNKNLVSINKLWQSLIGWPLTLRRVNLV